MVNDKTWTDAVQLEHGIMLCNVERVDSAGVPWVRFPDGRVRPAAFTTSVPHSELAAAPETGARAVVTQLSGSLEPVIVGMIATSPAKPDAATEPAPASAVIDGKQIVLTGEHEIVLRCGEASITLTKAGKILLRGTYVSTRSSGVNRIKGASVQIN